MDEVTWFNIYMNNLHIFSVFGISILKELGGTMQTIGNISSFAILISFIIYFIGRFIIIPVKIILKL